MIDDCDDDDLLEDGQPAPIRPILRKPEPSGDTRGGSWWTQTTPANHSATARAELARMASSREGKRQYRQLSEHGE